MDTATKQTWGGEAHKLLSDELKVISDILILKSRFDFNYEYKG